MKIIVGEANEVYRKVMTLPITLIVGYLALLWALNVFAGPGSITMTMWAFLIIFSFVFWQPSLGGVASVLEWFSRKDDPEKASVWRLYLFLVIGAILAGHIAITLQLMGSKSSFPGTMLALVLVVAIALLLPQKAQIDIWLPRIALFVIAISLFGVMFGIDPVRVARFGGINLSASAITESERTAKQMADLDLKLQDAQSGQVLKYVNMLRTCEMPTNEVSSWTPKQKSAYKAGCSKTGDARGITLGEMKTHWPDAYAAWEGRYGNKKGIKVAGGAEEEEVVADSKKKAKVSFLDDPIAWMYANPWYTLFLLALHIPVIWLIKRAWNNTASTTSKSESKSSSKSGSGGLILWFILLFAIGYGLMSYHKKHPEFFGNLFDSVWTSKKEVAIEKAQYSPKLHASDVHNWEVIYSQSNRQYVLPSTAWHGKTVGLGAGSRVEDDVELLIEFDKKMPQSNLRFDGRCELFTVARRQAVPKACSGYWRDGDNTGGAYYLVWDTMGRFFHLNLYATPALPQPSLSEQLRDAKRLPIATILVRKMGTP